jgi:CBS domain-containing protein
MLVRNAMTSGIVTANKEDSVRSIIEKMIMRHCGSIPVVGDDGDLIGIVTIRDAMLPMYPNFGDYVHDNVHARDFEEMEEGYSKVLNMKVEEIMTANPMTVSPDDPVLKAASFMGLRNLRRIPVAEGGKLAGMVSIGDISRAMFLANS